MKFRAEINVMPKEALLDPQGRAVQASLQKMGLEGIENTRIGKRITLEVEASSEKKASETVEKACRDLLHNPVVESYGFSLVKI